MLSTLWAMSGFLDEDVSLERMWVNLSPPMLSSWDLKFTPRKVKSLSLSCKDVLASFRDKFMVAKKFFSLASACSQASRELKNRTKSSAYLTNSMPLRSRNLSI